MALLGQNTRRHKPIAAVIPGPRNHDGLRSGRVAGEYGFGHRPPGILHQRGTRYPAGDGEAVGFRHLGGGEQFDHSRASLGRVFVLRQRSAFSLRQPRTFLHPN
jgi:hypothetical protein